ncbi:MAG: nucleotidyltransferase family protein [Ruminococcaceae bacterium]|nr:nucleotidyltransferase family protein [Oscillospiraceae bacterium]
MPKQETERPRSVGIICECNPPHEGHFYLMRQARAAGAEAVICVMSGCFTQRGEAAVLDPRTRAAILLDGGADAVFELPFPHSSASGEFFAAAGVSMLERLGVEELWFGSECGDLSLLWRQVELVESEAFLSAYREACREKGEGTAEAYFRVLTQMGGADGLLPNDTLGIAYLKAIRRTGASIKPHTVQRVGSGFAEASLRAGEIPSARALRLLLEERGVEAWRPYLSPEGYRLVSLQTELGLAPADLARAETAVLSFFRMARGEDLECVPELSGGLGRRISEAAHRSGSLKELTHRSGTKKYPEARIRRGILFAMLGVTEEDLRTPPFYAVLLGANRAGCRFLGAVRRSTRIPIVTCWGDLPQEEGAERQLTLCQRAWSLYTLCLPSAVAADRFLRVSSLILQKDDHGAE